MFVSHSRRNAVEAEQLCAVLEGAGISCWIAPRDIPPGRTWPASIAAGIADARLIAVLVSDASNASAEVAREVIAALDARRPLVPIRLHDVSPAGNLAYLLAGVQWHDAFSRDGRVDPSRLVDVIRPLLDDAENAAREPPTRPARRAIPGNLPSATTTLVGRDADLRRLAELLGTHRIVTLTGSGGVGKTRLALAAVAGAADRWTDGRYFDDLAPLTDAARVGETIAAVLGLPETAPDQIEAAIERALQDGSTVIVLDNCEHVIAEVARHVHALARATPVTIVATSREPLRIDGEVVYRVPSLDLDAAVTLFAERAAAASQTFRLSDENRATVEGIARAVDRIPFAIELAAARLRAMTPAEIAGRLSARFRLLTGGNRAALPRQQTLHATIDWSHDLLGDAERQVFRRLAIFADGWTLDAASAACADAVLDAWDVADHVASLVDKSLVMHDADTGRYRFLESTHAYAREQLDAANERDDVARRHLAWFGNLAETGEREWTTRPLADWRTTYAADIENLRLALTTALSDGGDAQAGVRLAAALRPFWIAVGRPAEGVAWCERALAVTGDDGSLAIGKLLLTICRLLEYGIHVGRRLAAATRAAEICRAHGDERATIQALQDIAFALCEKGERAGADARADEALQRARAFGDLRIIAHCLQTRSFTVDPHDLDARRALLEEAYANATELKSETERASYLMWLAELEADAGNGAAARQRGIDALAILAALGDRLQAAYCSANLCAYELDAGSLDMAEAYLADALRLADGNVPLLTAVATQYVAEIALFRGDAEAAARAKGYGDARMVELDVVRGTTEERSSRRLDAGLRARLDPATLARLTNEGRALDEDAVLRLASPSIGHPSSGRIASGSR